MPTPRLITGQPAYAVDEHGNVFSRAIRGCNTGALGEWRQLKTFPDRAGYTNVNLGGGERRYVHRLVLEAFVGPCPPGMECRHLDGDRSNNHISNLCWGTSSQNHADRVVHGTSGRGEAHPRAKLKCAEVLEIVRRRRAGERNVDIARRFGVRQQTISSIMNGRNWSHLTGLSPNAPATV